MLLQARKTALENCNAALHDRAHRSMCGIVLFFRCLGPGRRAGGVMSHDSSRWPPSTPELARLYTSRAKVNSQSHKGTVVGSHGQGLHTGVAHTVLTSPGYPKPSCVGAPSVPTPQCERCDWRRGATVFHGGRKRFANCQLRRGTQHAQHLRIC